LTVGACIMFEIAYKFTKDYFFKSKMQIIYENWRATNLKLK
jgi:hypothetical protein